jgi:hypothetical protein
VIIGLRRSGQVSSVPSQAWKPPIGRRYTKKDVGPAASMSRAKLSLTPSTTEDRATTTNTPMATPMMVSQARTLLARSAAMAIFTPSRTLSILISMLTCYSWRSASIGSSREARRAG